MVERNNKKQKQKAKAPTVYPVKKTLQMSIWEGFALVFLLIELCQNRGANRAETIHVDRIMENHVQHRPDIRRTALRNLIPRTLYRPGLPLRWIKAQICGQLFRLAE